MPTQNQSTDFSPSPTSASMPPNSASQIQSNSSGTPTEEISPRAVSERRWKRPRFNADNLVPQPMCVAWIDIMGTKNAMLHSLRTAANFVAKLHGDIVESRNNLKACGSLRILPMMDGAYVVGPNIAIVQRLIRRVLRQCAERFLKESDPIKKCMLRATLSWGNVIHGDDLHHSLPTPNEDRRELFQNVMVGMPFVWCNETEKNAPPFGLYVHVSVREHTQTTKCPMGWSLDRWWPSEGTSHEKLMAASLAQAIRQHLAWLDKNPTESSIDSEHIKKYNKLVDEYFGSSVSSDI